MVLCQPARRVMEKIQLTTVWTEMATGMMTTAIAPMHRSKRCHSSAVPVNPSESLL